MVYIESHQQLGVHPKTKKASRLLQISRPAVIGHLQYFWWWAMDFAKDGDVTNYSADVIADGAMWDGDPDAFITALVDCAVERDGHGFLERQGDRLLIHDWMDYGGKLVGKRETDAERKRREREEEKQRGAEEKRRAEEEKQREKQSQAVVKSSPEPSGTMLSEGCPKDGVTVKDASFLCPSDVPRTAQVEQQTTTKQRQTEQSEDNNNQEERSAEERNAAVPATSSPPGVDAECRVVVVSSLCDLGVSELVAEDLTRRRTCEQITKQVEWLPYRVKEREGTPKPVRDPAALLVKAIEDGYAPPVTYSRAKLAEADKAHRTKKAQEKAQHELAEQEAAKAGQERMETAWQALADDEQADIGQEAEAVLLSESFFADLARKNPDGWRLHRGAVPRLLAQRNALMLARGHLPATALAPSG